MALETDAAEVLVNPGPVRLLVATGELFPEFGARLARAVGVNPVMDGWVARNKASGPRS